ncbi:MAG: UDP-N-acetylglucosamine 1-carboxyvinyltransferase [Halobacteriovoraceae bacterium]|nr:UDP-N-acetylglucosamine 1-carboxyvinyltransferase [Halobacteriovoraceae bacterium]MCB9095630.1 UDP-N-acetylglucosamine 1-carboxyvinyltransferase [Halobacteriovoraceae bacterium]
MDVFLVEGPNKLSGEVRISTSKNSSLPIMAATILSKKKIALSQLPHLRDIRTMRKLLESLGCRIEIHGDEHYIDPKSINHLEAPYELVKTMRASILVLGPLLARFGEAKVSLPGGCAIGARPVDLHIEGLKKLGAEIHTDKGYVLAKAKKLVGCEVDLPFPSVGATENLLMAATFAEGTTKISNAAREPEIEDLALFLCALYPELEIQGAGTHEITIKGISKDSAEADIVYTPIPDRIEAATFIIAGLMCNSDLAVVNCRPHHLESFLEKLKAMGAIFDRGEEYVHVKPCKEKLKGIDIQTEPYPGFPTDVQAQMMSLLSVVNGKSVITEKIFENRFMHVPELVRMGAQISLDGNKAVVEGNSILEGAPVMCTDLRASAALVLTSLVANGKTRIQRVYHVDRGYEGIDKKFFDLGAKIKRLNEPME